MKILPLLVSLAWSPTLFAATDLLQMYQEALTQDATLQSAKSAQIAGQEALPQGRALLLPSVNLSANSQYNDIDTQFRSASVFASARRQRSPIEPKGGSPCSRP